MSKAVVEMTYTWYSSGISSFISGVLTDEDTRNTEKRLVVAENKGSIFDERIARAGVKPEELAASGKGIIRAFSSLAAFKRFLKENSVSAIHLHCSCSPELAYLAAAKKAGVPLRIAHCHNVGFEKGPVGAVKTAIHRLFRIVYKNSPNVNLACSREAGEWMFGGRETQIIPNGIDVCSYEFSEGARRDKRRELGIGDGEFVLINIGRLSFQKNQEFLLDVFFELLKDVPEAVLLLAGEGENREMLERRAAELAVEGRVRFLGLTSEIPQLLSAADAFCLPSRYEGFVISAIEAQASGIPCFVSDQVVKESDITGTMCRIPAEDPVKWAKIIAEIATSRPRYDRSDMIVKAGFDTRNTAKILDGIYRTGAGAEK